MSFLHKASALLAVSLRSQQCSLLRQLYTARWQLCLQSQHSRRCRIKIPALCSKYRHRTLYTTVARYSDKVNDEVDVKHIEELKILFKDDPQLETWMTEIQDDTISTEKNSTTDSNAIDIDKELLRYNIEEFYDDYEYSPVDESLIQEEYESPISYERGKEGVFDIEEMVELLKAEHGQDLCVISVPQSIAYVDHLVLVTGRSLRHLKAIAHAVRWTYKKKRGSKDRVTCDVEGLQSNDWLAIDLGNMAVHMMLNDTRQAYDIETLWTVGPEYDNKVVAPLDSYLNLFTSDTPAPNEDTNNVENVLTLNEKARYTYEEDSDSHVEQKYSSSDQHAMESMTGWHDINSITKEKQK